MRIESTSSTSEIVTTIDIPSSFSTNGHEVNTSVNGFHKLATDLPSEVGQVPPLQPCFPEWDIAYIAPSFQREVSAISSKVRTHKEEREQPYLLPSLLIEDSETVLARMEHALADWEGREKPFGTFEKLRQFADMRELYRGIPAYIIAEDDLNLRMPNPLMGEIMSAYGKLHQKGKEDPVIKDLLENEARKYERHHSAYNHAQAESSNGNIGILTNRLKKGMRIITSFLQ